MSLIKYVFKRDLCVKSNNAKKPTIYKMQKALSLHDMLLKALVGLSQFHAQDLSFPQLSAEKAGIQKPYSLVRSEKSKAKRRKLSSNSRNTSTIAGSKAVPLLLLIISTA